MRRIKATVFAIVAIIIAFFILAQASDIGAPFQFSLVAVVIIAIIVISLIKTWLRF
jgi:membrane protein implicated in regulation of membrane protease activity